MRRNRNPNCVDKSKSIPSWFNNFDIKTPRTKLNDKFYIKKAKQDEVYEANELFQDLAKRGQGYGVDEFTAEGYYCCKLLYQTAVYRIEDENHFMVGCAVFGPSRLGRNRNIAASCYIAIKNDYQNMRIGTKVMEYFINQAKMLNFSMFFCDVLDMPGKTAILNILLKQGFVTSGTLMKSAFMKDTGPVNAMLFYKILNSDDLAKL